MKKLLLLINFLLPITLFGQPSYCTPTYSGGPQSGDYIGSVSLSNLNVSNGTTFNPPYYYYQGSSAHLDANTSYTITLTSGSKVSSSGQQDDYAVWIDYDMNYNFDANELIGQFTTTSTGCCQVFSFTFTTPNTLHTSFSRMRIVCAYGAGSITSCGNYISGSTEDYDITLNGSSPISYCIPGYTFGTANQSTISNVTLGNNLNAYSSGSNFPFYTFMVSTENLAKNSHDTLYVSSGGATALGYAAWIDYNHDGVFSSSEKLGEQYNASSFQVLNFPFVVPTSSLSGQTVLRVRCASGSSMSPCNNYQYGETEDYEITILSPAGINEANKPSILLIPNPASDYVQLKGITQSMQYVIKSIEGAIVKTGTVSSGTNTIELSNIANGCYLLQLQDEPSYLTSKLIIAN